MEKYLEARRAKCFVAAVSVFCIDSENYEYMMRRFDEIPAADVAPVVRCRDCVDGNPACMSEGLVWCEALSRGMSDDDFCSMGRKKEEST